MKVFLNRRPNDTIVVRAGIAGEGYYGDMSQAVRPGDTFLGKTHAEWLEMPEGENEIEVDQ